METTLEKKLAQIWKSSTKSLEKNRQSRQYECLAKKQENYLRAKPYNLRR